MLLDKDSEVKKLRLLNKQLSEELGVVKDAQLAIERRAKQQENELLAQI